MTTGCGSVAVSSSGDRLFSGSQDSTLRFWDLTAGSQTEELVQNSAVWTVAISADDMKVAIGLEDGALKVVDSWTGETLFEDTEAHTEVVYSVEFSPDGKLLATGSWDKTIRLWNMEKCAAIGIPVEEHIREVASFAFSRNGQQLVSGGGEGTVLLWDVVPAQSDCNSSNGPVLIQRLMLRLVKLRAYHLLVMIQESYQHRSVALFAFGTHCLSRKSFEHSLSVNGISLSPDGSRVLSASSDGTARMWSTQNVCANRDSTRRSRR